MFKKQTNSFTIITQILVIILPFYVFLTVFFTNVVWINNFWFYIKELLLALLFWSLVYEYIKKEKIPNFDLLDYLIFFYIFYWITITLINWLWLKSIVYWWRYDYMFLIVMLIYKHWREFLKINRREIMKLFLYSWTWALLFWFLLKFRFKEEFLIEFWFIDYVSNWVYSWWIPIYHWLENSWLRRFQWIFDWPNAMAYFLILYWWIFLFLQKKKNEFYVFIVMLFLFWLLILTYSRSSILWIFWALWLIFLLNIKLIYKKYKKILLVVLSWGVIMLSFLWILFQDQLTNIVFRKASTTWHFDRMAMWIERFTEKPFWAWLAESWPAYRYIYPDKQTKADELKYIPESRFIQVLIEWWVIYFLTFISILYMILRKLYSNSVILFWVLVAIIIMNLFLHIFEVTYVSILTFIFVWLFLKNDKIKL